MSNAIEPSPPPSEPSAPDPVSHEEPPIEEAPVSGVRAAAPPIEEAPVSGVRAAVPATEPRHVVHFRWKAVFAGLVLGIGTQVLLGLFGIALGLSVVRGRPGVSSLALGTSLWMSLVSLISVFVGAFTASRLSGAIRRAEGALAGALTWGTALVAVLFVAAASPTTTYIESASFPVARVALTDEDDDAGPSRSTEDARIVAWAGFIAVVASLGAGVAGGILGVSERRGRATAR
jgi:hypothetical protein